jgi:hypothetical protein
MRPDDHFICREGIGSLNSVDGIASRNEIEGRTSSSFEGEIFRPHTVRPCNLRSLLYNGYSFYSPGLRRPGRGPNHLRSSSAFHPSAWHVTG